MILYSSYSDVGGRPVNEDTAAVREEAGSVCAVLADGLGGHGGGDVASRTAAELILDGWSPDADANTLKALTWAAHEKILSMQTQLCEMKTTIVVLSCGKTGICYAYVGDSRLYHFSNGVLEWQTTDHSASQIAVFMGQIKPEEIRFHTDRSRILRALGLEGMIGADVGVLSPKKGKNAFLLCSDGFWEYVLEKEMEETLCMSSSPEDWIARMRSIRDSRAPADCDNNSAVAVWSAE